MIKTSIERMSRDIGFDIGNSDDISQSNLINGLSEGILNSIPDKNDLDTQICYIVDKLNPKSKELITKLYEFIKLK